MAALALAHGKSDINNAHHYLGGPKTEVPHGVKHPKTTGAAKATANGGHHYGSGPKTESHHMGDKK